MLPVLFDLPQLGVAIHSRGVMIVLAALLCHVFGPRAVESLEGIDRHRARRALLWLLVPAVLGARLHYVASHWASIGDPLAALTPWGRGMHAGGAIVAIALGMPLILWRLSIPIGKFADAIAAPIAVAIAVARLGCWLRGCCYGDACAWPWGVRFPDGALPYGEAAVTAGAALHPLQLYFVLAALFTAAAALAMYPRKRYDGQVALVALLLYSMSSAAIEPWRADHPGRVYWGALPQLEWTALAMTAFAAAALLVAHRAHRRAAFVRRRLA